ncbi:MAG: twin transmembrane helix small protein [Alphaproteobacteria bacterium]|nr:twin transmembrane helix small protein [Alphaproteobacteria bacterium]
MSTVFFVFLVLAMAATVGALVWGLIAMARGGEFNAKWSNKMMQYRVLLQAAALLVFALLLSLTKAG